MVNIAEVKAEVKIAVILGFIVFRIVLQCFTRKFASNLENEYDRKMTK